MWRRIEYNGLAMCKDGQWKARKKNNRLEANGRNTERQTQDVIEQPGTWKYRTGEVQWERERGEYDSEESKETSQFRIVCCNVVTCLR